MGRRGFVDDVFVCHLVVSFAKQNEGKTDFLTWWKRGACLRNPIGLTSTSRWEVFPSPSRWQIRRFARHQFVTLLPFCCRCHEVSILTELLRTRVRVTARDLLLRQQPVYNSVFFTVMDSVSTISSPSTFANHTRLRPASWSAHSPTSP